MIENLFQTAIIVSILTGMIRVGTPILLAALGVMIADRSGVMNLGVEGTMLMGAFLSFTVTHQTGSYLLGILAALVAGGAMSLIMVFMASTLKTNQAVTGVSLNLLASGLSFYWYRITYPTTMPSVPVMKIIKIRFLSEIPVIGEVVFSHNLLTYFALLMVPVMWFFLYKTKYGLELRCLGENPRFIDTKGISVVRFQYLATIIGGMFNGLGGAFLTIGSVGLFVPDISAGRGWLAIVVTIAGNWIPARILIATLVIAFLEAFQLQAQALGVQFPYQILLALPYTLAIILMAISRFKSDMPTYLGIPYFRE